jgi:alpha-galactosidase
MKPNDGSWKVARKYLHVARRASNSLPSREGICHFNIKMNAFFRTALLALPLAFSAPVFAAGSDLPALNPAIFTSKNAPAGAIWLDSLDLANFVQGHGKAMAAESISDKPLTMAGVVYPHGVGTHAESRANIDLKGNAVRFATMFGIDAETKDKGSAALRITVDGQLRLETPTMRGGQPPIKVDVDLRGAQTMRLEVLSGVDASWAHGDLAGAVLFLTPAAIKEGEAAFPILVPPPPQAAGKLPPFRSAPPQPRINGTRLVGASPGKPFLHLIPATGRGPLVYSAQNLPEGLSLDAKTGIISGRIARAGNYSVQLGVKGPAGSDRRILRIECGPNKLALTPILGWNAWSVFGEWVTARGVAEQADWMVKSGLAARGWQYIIIDDTWQSRRDADGTIGANRRFGSMKSLSEYVHSKGLKIGLLSAATPGTCSGFAGSAGWEEKDAALYERWGIDFVKYDWCPDDARKGAAKREEIIESYKKMRQALDKTNRDIVLSMVTYNFGGDPPSLGREAGAQMWRTSSGIIDSWDSLSSVAFGQEGHVGKSGPGGWADFGPLMVGRFTPRNPHFSNLKPDEQKLQVTAWVVGASPMVITCDMSQLDPNNFYRLGSALLLNPEVLEVHQDELGRPAKVLRGGDLQVWTRELAGGRVAVGIFNRRWGKERVTISMSDLGLSGAQPVRDLWAGKELGPPAGEFTVEVPSHGAHLLVAGPPAP